MAFKFVGKGDPLVYWKNTGRHFGFPDCCIQAFLDMCSGKRGGLPKTEFDGTGYRPCDSCAKKDPSKLVSEINSRRLHPNPFPDSNGFESNYKDKMYGEILQMTFDEWFEEERVGYSREEELSRALHVDEWKVTQMLEEAYEAGWRQGHKEGYAYRETVALSAEGGV